MTLMTTALDLAARGIPVLPLGRGKIPVANCHRCQGNRCGGRPHMLSGGPCACPRPCHAWAAATTDPATLRGYPWHRAGAIGHHPAGSGVTVVDLDDAAAVEWARWALPPTRVVETSRGQHWIYSGTCPSRNAVRPGVDVKGIGAHCVWRGWGTGTTAPLPDAVRTLVSARATARRTAPTSRASLSPHRITGAAGCPHRSPAYLDRGVQMAADRIRNAPKGTGHFEVYRAYLAVLAKHGRCGCLRESHRHTLISAALDRGADRRRAEEQWAGALRTLGL